jgi:DNA-binding NarL/FixJ family response regulator
MITRQARTRVHVSGARARKESTPSSASFVLRFGAVGVACTMLEIGRDLVAVYAVDVGERPSPLTDAEVGVLRSLLEGKSNAEIAKERGTATRTIANQVASIFRKHGLSSRAELAAFYYLGTLGD